jgi:sulfite reductase (NADPH) flavoprotein alpha-component
MAQPLPVLPDTAPFPEAERRALNTVMAATTAEQRTWLAGFLAGYQAGTGSARVEPPAAPPAARAPLSILYATESGNTEALAAAARKAAQKLGFAPRVLDMADTSPADLAKSAKNLVVLASTWGEGDPPQRAADFFTALMADNAPRFEGIRFAVLALGDRAYVNFCATGRQIDERLHALGGERIASRIDCDLDYEAQAATWLNGTLETLKPTEKDAVIHVDFARAVAAEVDPPRWNRSTPFAAEISELVTLSGSRSSSRTVHAELSLAGSGLTYEPGDALGVLPSNDPELVDQVLGAVGLRGDDALRTALTHQLDITTLTPGQIALHADATGDPELAAIAGDAGRTAAFLRDRQLIDLLEAAPATLAPEQVRALLRPLPPRLYSIASSLKAAPGEAHILVAAVGWESHGRARKGVASRDIADRRRVGQTMPIYLKPNPHFRLPADPDRKLIMVGPGTGVAPFRGFLQEREATGARGASWLFFGNRNFTHDFTYQLEWQDFLKSGVLSRIDVAFSRDQREKIYVQHRMWEARRELFAWLEDGAALYVCGDASAMAKDVHATLLRIVAEQSGRGDDAAHDYVRALQKSGRYLRDVY